MKVFIPAGRVVKEDGNAFHWRSPGAILNRPPKYLLVPESSQTGKSCATVGWNAAGIPPVGKKSIT